MGLTEAVLYGLIQGLTEFLPISSTAHLRIVPGLLGWPDPGAAFTAVIQIGTLLAVFIYFRSDLVAILSGWIRAHRADSSAEDRQHGRIAWAVVVGTIPIIVAALALESKIKGSFRSLYVIAAALIVMGVLLFVADHLGKKSRPESKLSVRDGFIVGLWQVLSLVPGASRSGSTITGGLLAGLDRSTAARFSFLLSIPSVLAAGIKELYDERAHILGSELAPVLVATLVSFVVGYASIEILLRHLRTRNTNVFVYYRVALGLLLLVLLKQGVLQPMQGSP